MHKIRHSAHQCEVFVQKDKAFISPSIGANFHGFIFQNFQHKITVDQLSDKFGIVRRTFERRFKKSTRNTVVEYIQRVKIEAAKKSFETSRKTIYDVMYDVGYTDIKAFRDVFKRITGMPPIDYRNKYNKDVVTVWLLIKLINGLRWLCKILITR